MPKRLNDVCEENHLDDARVQAAQARMVEGLTATRLSDAFKGMSDPSRLRILSALGPGEISVYDLANVVAMTQSAVSHQLATLRDTGLVKFRKDGRKVYYSLEDEHVLGMLDAALAGQKAK